MTDWLKYLHHKFTSGRGRWYPLLAVYYLTYRCRFRCPYCSDGSGQPYYKLDPSQPTAEEASNYLQRIRKYCNYLVITGGEPMEHPEFLRVMECLPALKFKQVVLTTNGYQEIAGLPVLARAVDQLVFSLDTLDEKKADKWSGVAPGTLNRVMENLRIADEYRPRRYRISISAVVTPENILDLYEVYHFASQRGYEFAAAPWLMGVKAHPELVGNPLYRRFYDFLIREKKAGRPVFGTLSYLQYMRDLQKFQCYPFTMLVVGPTGTVFYPCLELGQRCGFILEDKNLHQLRQQGEALFGPQPACDNRCHSACALGFSLALKNPLPFIYDSLRSYLSGKI